MESPFYNMSFMQGWGETTRVTPNPSPFENLGRPTRLMPPSTKLLCKNLIINYLPQSFTDKNLFDLFVPFGPLHSVKIMRETKVGPPKIKKIL